jgi:signal peptidase II
MTRLDGWRRALAVAGTVVLVDQITKALIVAHRMLGERESVFIGIDLNYVRNSGVAFGAFAGGRALVWVLTGLALAGLLVYFTLRADRAWLWLPVGAIAGGALGNLADRARDGSVVDFIDPIAWPAFNIADIAIVVGILGFVWVAEGGGSRESGGGSPVAGGGSRVADGGEDGA